MGTVKQDAVIFDLDGTLADITHRLHFMRGKKKNWRKFFEAMTEDTLRQDVYTLYQKYAQEYAVLIVSGRPDTYRNESYTWLASYGILSPLYMRKEGDYRPDTIVKAEIYEQYIEPFYNIVAVVDDRPSVLRLWAVKGLYVIDVGDGVEF